MGTGLSTRELEMQRTWLAITLFSAMLCVPSWAGPELERVRGPIPTADLGLHLAGVDELST